MQYFHKDIFLHNYNTISYLRNIVVKYYVIYIPSIFKWIYVIYIPSRMSFVAPSTPHSRIVHCKSLLCLKRQHWLTKRQRCLNLEQFFPIFLSFLTLTFLKNLCHFCCGTFCIPQSLWLVSSDWIQAIYFGKITAWVEWTSYWEPFHASLSCYESC